MKRFAFVGLMALTISAFGSAQLGTAAAAPPPKVTIWYEDELVRTLVPKATPQEGTDAFYRVPGVGGVAAVAPGDPGYHGGHWAVHDVSGGNMTVAFAIGAYGGLNSADEIRAAAEAGDITVTRNAGADFLCPIQPGNGAPPPWGGA